MMYTRVACRTYYRNKVGCKGVHLDLDNTNGGDKGPETITYSGFETTRR